MIYSFSGEYSFLSNFYICNVLVRGHDFKSSEHAYQAFKTLDEEWFNKIKNAATPGETKRLGKKVPIRDDWDDIKIRVMYEIVWMKFFQNVELAKKLLATGDRELIEGNWWNDTFWGVCKGVGSNHLGKILMHVRADIKYTLRNGPPPGRHPLYNY